MIADKEENSTIKTKKGIRVWETLQSDKNPL